MIADSLSKAAPHSSVKKLQDRSFFLRLSTLSSLRSLLLPPQLSIPDQPLRVIVRILAKDKQSISQIYSSTILVDRSYKKNSSTFPQVTVKVFKKLNIIKNLPQINSLLHILFVSFSFSSSVFDPTPSPLVFCPLLLATCFFFPQRDQSFHQVGLLKRQKGSRLDECREDRPPYVERDRERKPLERPRLVQIHKIYCGLRKYTYKVKRLLFLCSQIIKTSQVKTSEISPAESQRVIWWIVFSFLFVFLFSFCFIFMEKLFDYKLVGLKKQYTWDMHFLISLNNYVAFPEKLGVYISSTIFQMLSWEVLVIHKLSIPSCDKLKNLISCYKVEYQFIITSKIIKCILKAHLSMCSTKLIIVVLMMTWEMIFMSKYYHQNYSSVILLEVRLLDFCSEINKRRSDLRSRGCQEDKILYLMIISRRFLSSFACEPFSSFSSLCYATLKPIVALVEPPKVQLKLTRFSFSCIVAYQPSKATLNFSLACVLATLTFSVVDVVEFLRMKYVSASAVLKMIRLKLTTVYKVAFLPLKISPRTKFNLILKYAQHLLSSFLLSDVCISFHLSFLLCLIPKFLKCLQHFCVVCFPLICLSFPHFSSDSLYLSHTPYIKMDAINPTILKTKIEAIPTLTEKILSAWQTLIFILCVTLALFLLIKYIMSLVYYLVNYIYIHLIQAPLFLGLFDNGWA
ncbi:hypothetical protein VP01_1664g4 [Puccinia sorghi]|uniref:Uncharacterized protein n=1 Tax=Puccinia sorghi TaxID=27349 RepID=A0A0L6VI17_9BASI|nr:hypothetical protein VP01_1664g4 [Puccinia sorghi]